MVTSVTAAANSGSSSGVRPNERSSDKCDCQVSMHLRRPPPNGRYAKFSVICSKFAAVAAAVAE